MNTTRHIAVTAAIGGLLAAALLGIAAPAQASDADVIAADTTAAPAARPAWVPSAVAAKPRTIVVTGHGGRSVTLFAKGERIRRILAPGTRPAVFTGLTPGRTYVVAVGGEPIGNVVAVDRPSPATGLQVRRSGPGAVALSWRHSPSAATGPVRYEVVASAPGAPTVRTTVAGKRTTELSGLDRSARYTFTVTPRNSAGTGRPTRATMAKTLAELGDAEPVVSAVAPAREIAAAPAAPAPSAPAPAPGPSTRTVYRCPATYTETSSGLCQTTKEYTFTYLPYTFHKEATGPAPMLNSYETAVRACPSGYNLEDYGWVMYCRLYGPVPTITVKDSPPAGYTDDGTQWVSKDPAPAGYVDDGTQWVKLVPKQAVTIPA